MKIFRSSSASATFLLGAAVLALILANSPLAEAIFGVRDTVIGLGAISLSAGGWVSDGLLAIFFFAAAIELKYEFTKGDLNSPDKAFIPAFAAFGGIVIPALIFVVMTTSQGLAAGWPIPTATDIAFALGVLAVFGRGLPSRIRTFLLALAILDDIVAIVIIAIFFTSDLNLGVLGLGVLAVIAFGALSYVSDRLPVLASLPVFLALGITAWSCFVLSGVHATIAGVALGFAMKNAVAQRIHHHLEPWVNGLILPLFAFTAALVPFPSVSTSGLSIVFWAITLALPIGKLIGISLFGKFAMRISKSKTLNMDWTSIIAAGFLGGIGFTVSLLMSELAYPANVDIKNQAILGVLAGSLISLIIGGMLIAIQASKARRMSALAAEHLPKR